MQKDQKILTFFLLSGIVISVMFTVYLLKTLTDKTPIEIVNYENNDTVRRLNKIDGQTRKQEEEGQSQKKKEKVDSLIDINTADQKMLVSLPGIGEGLAESIIDYRTKNGLFRNEQELKMVAGIGEKRFEKLAPYLKKFGSPSKSTFEQEKTTDNEIVCPYCKMKLKTSNTRHPFISPYCTGCLRYLYDKDKKIRNQRL